MENALQKNQNVSLLNFKVLTMNGVIDIAAFDEGYILLETSVGNISIEGNNMKIDSLSSETGEIVIHGDISGFYTNQREKRVGIFARLFG